MTSAFPLMEGPLCLDLANTLVGDRPDRDLLRTPEQLADWLAAQEIRSGVTAAHLEELRAMRAAIRSLLCATVDGLPPDPAAIALLNASSAPRASRLIATDSGLEVVETVEGDAGDRLRAALARSAMEVLAGPRRHRLRACPGPGCRLLFEAADSRRRWCDSRVCGNRVRVARHRGKR